MVIPWKHLRRFFARQQSRGFTVVSSFGFFYPSLTDATEWRSLESHKHRSPAVQALARYISRREFSSEHTFLGLLAKIKCSICSYQFNI
ncbi:hypothetical protein KC19_7G165200 [Ceratodon purpureus]|uniref:Uncharacterized protein n=1 Tax=Ceratodon purpureus TaxID=3225 RepID=A0A8T0HC01_CERPU|nr:hypothetical protein KC19_7G165200 [Ceratodon purpureus]